MMRMAAFWLCLGGRVLCTPTYVAETPRRPQTSRFNPLLESKAHRKPHDAAENEYVAAEASS